MESLYESNFAPLEIGKLIRRRWPIALLAFAAVIALTLAYFGTAARIYRSEAKLFFRIGRETVTLDPTATTGQVMAAADTRESEVLAVDELLRSRALAENIVKQFGADAILERDPQKPGLGLSQKLAFLEPYNLNPLRVYSLSDKAIKALQKNIKTVAIKKTSVLTVSYEAQTPQLARDVLIAILQLARDEHLRVHRTKGSQEFFVDQANLLRTNLGKLEEQLRELKDQSGLAALVSQREIKLQMIGSLQGDLVRAKAELDAAQAEVDRRRQQLRDQPAMVVTEQTSGQPQTTRQTLRERLYELEIKEQELAVKLTPEAPLLTHIRNQIAEARRIMVEEQPTTQTTKGVNPTHQAAELALQEREAQLVAVTARTRSLDGKIAAIQTELKELNASELELTRLEREIELARTNYRKYAENLEQARIDQELEQAKITSLNMIQPPSFSVTPVSPQPMVTFAAGLACALLSGFGAMILAERRRSPQAGLTISPVVSPPIPRRSEIAPANPR